MSEKSGRVTGIAHRQDMKNLSFWITLCFTVGLTIGRKVSLPAGPLIRVEGEALSLRCEVSDYQGPKEQEFDWKVTNGSKTVQVVSTFDSSFPDQTLIARVLTDDISLKRIDERTVELKIKIPRVTDSGIFTCSTPSTDSVVNGNYEADVMLRVIHNTLLVITQDPAKLVHEGRLINLHCNTTRDYIEGISLSVTWSVKKDQSIEQDLLTFGPDTGVTVGENFIQRYADGEMQLFFENVGSYTLVISGAVPEDQGMYLCTAKQWTREQGTWNSIQKKTEVIGEVAVIPTAKSLTVRVLHSTILHTGDNLNLTCLVWADDLAVLDIEVTWLLNETQILTNLSRDGVVGKAPNVFSFNQVGEGDYRLEIHNVDVSDKGLYSCSVRAWIQQRRGKWYQAAEKTSTPVQVVISPEDPAITVTINSPLIAKYLGDPTELVCQVFNISLIWGKQLSVSWFYSSAPSNASVVATDVIASLNENGVIIPSDKYKDRIASGLILVTRTEPATFRLRLLHTTNADAGEYACSVTTWTINRSGLRKYTSEHRANSLKVSLDTKGPGISVVARYKRKANVIGSTFEMNCLAKLKTLWGGLSLSVLLRLQDGVDGPSRTLASLSHDMVLKLEDWPELSRQDSLSLVKTGNTEFLFRIQGVQMKDRGFYSCEVAAWTKPDGNNWVEMAKGQSNKVQLNFEHTRPSFDVLITSDTSSVYPWETVKIDCTISALGTFNTENVAYEIRWYRCHLWGSSNFIQLASIDRWGVVRKSPRNDTSDCSLEHLKYQTFTLTIHGTQDSDAGEYYCTATPWIRPTTTEDWRKEPEITSSRVFLSVKFALWDSMKLPLLYGTGTSLTVGVFSVILGLLCSLCCCRKTTQTPHTRLKLLNPQID